MNIDEVIKILRSDKWFPTMEQSNTMADTIEKHVAELASGWKSEVALTGRLCSELKELKDKNEALQNKMCQTKGCHWV